MSINLKIPGFATGPLLSNYFYPTAFNHAKCPFWTPEKSLLRIRFAQDNFPNLRCFTVTKLAEAMPSKDDSHGLGLLSWTAAPSRPRHLVPLQNTWDFAMSAMRKDVVGRSGLPHQRSEGHVRFIASEGFVYTIYNSWLLLTAPLKELTWNHHPPCSEKWVKRRRHEAGLCFLYRRSTQGDCKYLQIKTWPRHWNVFHLYTAL